MKCYRYYESGRPIYLIIMRYNPLLSNYKADGRLQLCYRVTTDCGTFHDLLMEPAPVQGTLLGARGTPS